MLRNKLKTLTPFTVAAYVLLALILVPPIMTLATYAESAVSPQPVNPSPIQQPPSEPTTPPSPNSPIVVPSNPEGGSNNNEQHVVIVPPSTPTTDSGSKTGSQKPQPPIEPIPPTIMKKVVLVNTTSGKKGFENYRAVHLITGDVVFFAKVNGKYVVNVKPVTPEEKFYTVVSGDHLYVIPASINLRKFDISLFDVTYLAKYYSKLNKLPIIVKLSQKVQVPSRTILRKYIKDIQGAHGTAFTIIKGFSMAIPVSELHKAFTMLSTDPAIEKVVLDRVVRVASEPISAADVKATLYDSVELVGATYAWNLAFNGTGIKVAILDTGIDSTHPDFYFPNGTSKIIANSSFVDFNFDGVPDEDITDGFGHGTHCAGIIAGTGEASDGSIKGVAPGALLIVGKVLSNYGWGYEDWIINGIQWAVQEGANVISMSLGGSASMGYDPLEDAVKNATEQGVVMVIAAGNEGPDFFTVGSPGTTPQAITVAAVDKSLNPAWFTSVGPTPKLQLKPDIAAPGVMIVSARANNTYMGPPASKYYVFASGTSMATPHVAGLVAIIEQAIKERAQLLGQQIPMTPEDIKYMLMSYSQPLQYSPLQVGIGFANITNLVSALTNTSDYVIYVEPPNTTVLGGSGLQDLVFTVKIIPGEDTVNKTLYLSMGPAIIPWMNSFVNATAITNVTPSFLAINISDLSVITLHVSVTVNWSAMGAGFHTMFFYVKSMLGTSPATEVRTMMGLFKVQHMTVTVTTTDGRYEETSGIVAIVPEFPCSDSVPQIFQFNELPVTINVPLVIPGVTYDIGVGASTSNLLITTAYDGNAYTDPSKTDFNFTIDLDQQLSSGFIKDMYLEYPFTSPGISTPVFVASELAVNRTTLAVYTFSNWVELVTVPLSHTAQYPQGIFVIDPALTAIWPDESGNLRIYEALHQLPESDSYGDISGPVFSVEPNFKAQIILRTIGDQLVYVPLELMVYKFPAISAQYGFLTPKVINVLIYCNSPDEVLGLYTPAYIYVKDDSGNDVGYIVFDNMFLDYGSFYGSNVTETDPLRMPYGTTVWLSDISAWKGIDAQDYIVGEEYVRFLDSWWDTYGVLSSYTVLYINGKEVLVSPDDDSGVYTYGWASIGNSSTAWVLFRSYGTLSWAGNYVYFMKDMIADYNVTMTGLPIELTSGVPAYTMVDAFYYTIPGYGVEYVEVDPLTLNNVVPRNLTDTANITLILSVPPINNAVEGQLDSVVVRLLNASGYPVLTANVTEAIPLGEGNYYVTAQFSTVSLPAGEYGLEVLMKSTYNMSPITTTVSFDFRSYPAIKLEPLVLKPIYVGYEPYCNFTSIQEAINYAYPNQTIYVLPGTYFIDKPIVINKPVKIIGVVANGSEPVINMTTWNPYEVLIRDTSTVELANLTIFANDWAGSLIYGTNLYGLTLSNIRLVSNSGGYLNGIELRNVYSVSLSSVSIEVLNPENPGNYGIYVWNPISQQTDLSLDNVQISYQFMTPLWIGANPEYLTLKYKDVNVNEGGVLVPLTIYKYANAGSVNIVPASRYVFLLASNTSVTFSNAKLEWISAFAGINHANVTLSNIEFLNRTYPTRIKLNAEKVTLNEVKYLQPLASGVHTTISSIMLESAYSIINNSVVSNLWVLASPTYVYNTVVYVVPGGYGIYDHFVSDELIVKNVSIRGLSVTSKGTLGIYVMEVTSPSVMIKITDSSFVNLVYGVVLPSGIGTQVVKDNTFVDVDIPVMLLPPGSAPSWLGMVFGTDMLKWVDGFKPSFLNEESSLPSNITSRELIESASSSNSSKVFIYSNTFRDFRTSINATNLRRSVVTVVNNTFTPVSNEFPTLILRNASLVGLWLNVFNPASGTHILTLGSNVTYVNYNNFLTSNIMLNTSSTYLLDMRWNYLQCQLGTQCSMSVVGAPQYVRSSSVYRNPLPLPLKHLIPVVLLSEESVPSTSTNYVVLVPQGASTSVRLDFINPYDCNITYSYSIEPAPGVNVSDHELEGSQVLEPVYVNGAESNVSFHVTGRSPGKSAVYVNVDGFRYTYPVKVLPVTVKLGVEAPATALRGAKIPVLINVTVVNSSISSATVMVTLSNGLEVVDPITYRGASTVVLPVTFNGSSALIRLNLTDIQTGNATVEAYVYVLGQSTPVNHTSKTITVVPNPNVRFNIATYLGDNVTVNSFSYLEVRIDGDPNYSLLLNVTVRTLNKDVLALGYDGNSTVFNQVVRTDPYARIAYVYVPLKGVSVGNATVEVSATSIGDGVTRTVPRTIKVSPLIDWGFTSNITVVNNEDNLSEMSLKYPNTTLKAWMDIIVYSSKVSVSYEALNNLIGVPWGCVEQTTSPLLSDIEMYRYITQRNLWGEVSGSVNKTALEDYIRKGVNKLLNHHLSCNASNCWFGWYPGLEATKFFTIYGTLGLLRAYEFAYVDYKSWYGTTFDLGVNVQQLNESIAKLLKTVVDMRNSQGYWAYPPGQIDYISDDIPLTAIAVYVLSKGASLGYLPANMSREQTLNVIQQAVNWLEDQELASGGWAPSSGEGVACPYATAYVLRALAQASNVGVAVDASIITKALDFLNTSAKGGPSLKYWEPEEWEWSSFWGMDKYLTTAEVVEALAELNSTSIASELSQTYLSLMNNLSMDGAEFLILTASEWINTWNTYEGSAILMALNSVAMDLTFEQPLVVQVTVLLNGRTPIFNKDYTLSSRYSFYADEITINPSLLNQGKTYVIRASLVSGRGEAVVVAYSDYKYVVTSSTTSSTTRIPSIRLAKESRHLLNSVTTIVIHGKVYRIEQTTATAATTGTPGIAVSQTATPQYVARGMPVRVTIEIKPVNASSLFGVVVTEEIPTGFEAVVNLSQLGNNIAFDEDRFNKSGGIIINRSGTTLVLSGGKLAFAVQAVSEGGVEIPYTLIPVNVSEGKVTLPEVDAWMFYSPLGRKIGSALTATPSISVGMPFTVNAVSEIISKGVTLGNNSVLKWGDKINLAINMPSGVKVSLIIELISNGTTYVNITRSNCGNTVTISIDTLNLSRYVNVLSNSYVDLVIKVVKDGAVISQKTVRLHMANVSRYDLFKRMQSIELKYMQAPVNERSAIVANEIDPLSSIWGGG